ncbi:hypothetical protein LAZ40_11270 [Cereibacter sphaeroides]|uniref:hypothetical protein n=1 Tax=Cereibacter sphaeroides TaxID=1063 RepID=UPI001F2CF1D6|nr:hypothetical protein [Cereibacter sphaeroides]MCE6959623.1 hypothetical protein [Cereibacter sphaeroides]MCE6974517.1 hypothetical protein [Cereibacter sphaeroides]
MDARATSEMNTAGIGPRQAALAALMEAIEDRLTGYMPKPVEEAVLAARYGLRGIDHKSDAWNPTRITLTDEEFGERLVAVCTSICDQWNDTLPKDIRAAIMTAMDAKAEADALDVEPVPGLVDLLARTRGILMTPEELEGQRRSFAFGNAATDNPDVTREMVDTAAGEDLSL